MTNLKSYIISRYENQITFQLRYDYGSINNERQVSGLIVTDFKLNNFHKILEIDKNIILSCVEHEKPFLGVYTLNMKNELFGSSIELVKDGVKMKKIMT